MTNEIDIIINYLENAGALTDESEFYSLIKYLSTDMLVAWFVDEGYVDALDESEASIIRDYYDKHCR